MFGSGHVATKWEKKLRQQTRTRDVWLDTHTHTVSGSRFRRLFIDIPGVMMTSLNECEILFPSQSAILCQLQNEIVLARGCSQA